MNDPVVPGALRVSHAEREPIVERLQQAYADGRLDKEDLDLRLHLAMTAKTRADLAAVTRDLGPAPYRAPGTDPVPCRASDADPVPYAAPDLDPTANQRVLASLAHVLGIVTLFVGPLVMLCTGARRSPYVRQHIVTALNFQLTLLLVTVVTLGIGGLAYAVAWIVAAVAALLALSGTPFRYPYTLRLIR